MSSRHAKHFERRWHLLQNLVKNELWKEDPRIITDIMEEKTLLCYAHPAFVARDFGTPDFWDAVQFGFEGETNKPIGEYFCGR